MLGSGFPTYRSCGMTSASSKHFCRWTSVCGVAPQPALMYTRSFDKHPGVGALPPRSTGFYTRTRTPHLSLRMHYHPFGAYMRTAVRAYGSLGSRSRPKDHHVYQIAPISPNYRFACIRSVHAMRLSRRGFHVEKASTTGAGSVR
jgi:hypothetical protein